jgi:hypothetical protein
MNFGKADRYVTLLQTTNDNTDVVGQVVPGYGTFQNSWAKRIFNTGSEVTQADQLVGVQLCTYELRFIEGIHQYMLLHDNIDKSTWGITSISEVGRGDMIRLECFKKDNQ